MAENEKLTLKDIQMAAKRIAPIVHHTPLDHYHTFSDSVGREVYLKCENLQRTGSFKIRGAANKIASLTDEEKKCGVIAASAGNHAQGVALAATMQGITSTIFMPEGAPISKVMATRSYGAEVMLVGESYDEAYQASVDYQKKTGATFVHAFNDFAVMAGQGTLGLEILEDLPDVNTVVLPIGGGGLISGAAVALKENNPQIKIVGVQAEGCPAMYLSHRKKHICQLDNAITIADGIAVKNPGELTFPVIESYVDDIVTVSDEEIANAVLIMLERSKLVAEGSGAVPLAALLNNKVNIKGQKVVALVSGGNIDANTIANIITRGLVKAGRQVKLITSLPDKPGQLGKLLKILAEAKANILYINHDRAALQVAVGETQVYLTMETRGHDHVEEIIRKMTQHGYQVKVIS